MKVTYDKEADAAYIKFSNEPIAETDDAVDGLMYVDLTKDGRLVGIEFLAASKKFPLETLITFETDPKSLEDIGRMSKSVKQ